MNEFIDEDLYEYLFKHSSEEPEHLKKLNKETHLKILNPRMLSGHLQGRFLSLIAKIYKPKRVLEIGTYTGYSALCFSEGIEVDGEIHTIDKNEELLKIQSDYFKNCKATIKQYCGDALEIIPTINETFDLIFLDADKENYINYYNLIIDKLRVGGLIIADNVLWSGKVLKKNSKDEATKSLIEFNKLIKNDDRVHNVIIPVRDGLNLIYKN
jgi:predicted O-methyltransferase YrrM